MSQEIDIDGAVETYKLWCYRNGKSYVEPDLSRTEATTHKGKPALILRSENGQKLARLRIEGSTFVVSWVNWYVGANYRAGKKKYSISSYQV